MVSHGRDWSSGPIDISYTRKVSAPYAAIISSGVTMFFRLLPIFPYSRLTGSALVEEPAVLLHDLGGGHVEAALVGVGVGRDVALVDQPAERLLAGDVAQVEQDLVPEAGVQQVQHGVLDAADVQVDAADVARLARPSQYCSSSGSTICSSLPGSR